MIFFAEWSQSEFPVRGSSGASSFVLQERSHPMHLLPPPEQRQRQHGVQGEVQVVKHKLSN